MAGIQTRVQKFEHIEPQEETRINRAFQKPVLAVSRSMSKRTGRLNS